MACDGNCSQCKLSQCVKTLCNYNSEPKMEEKKMSEAVGGCHAGNEEKIGRLDERSNFNLERNMGCKYIAIIALVVAIGAAFIAWTALRDLDSVKDQLRNVRTELNRVEQKADEAKAEATRGYNYVRKNKRSLFFTVLHCVSQCKLN